MTLGQDSPGTEIDQVVQIPRLGALFRTGLPHLIEGTLVPLVVFYATLFVLDIWWALIGALVWSYLALARRLYLGQRVGGLLLLTAATLTARTAFAALSGSLVVYFIQPPLIKLGLGITFLVSVVVGRPAVQRFVGDFLPNADELSNRPAVERCFTRLTILWAVTLLIDAGLALWLLFNQSVATYVAAKTALNFGLKGAAILLSFYLFRRAMQRQGISVVAT